MFTWKEEQQIPVSLKQQDTKHLTAVAWTKKFTNKTSTVSRTKQLKVTKEDTGIINKVGKKE